MGKIDDFFGLIGQKLFKEQGKPLDVFLYAKESQRGMETFIHPEIQKLPAPMKQQIKALMHEALKQIDRKEVKKHA